jgi:D-glycero-alpha-D-manno-heptose-7-phosphate kinase
VVPRSERVRAAFSSRRVFALALLAGTIVRASDAGPTMIITRTPLRISLGGGGTDLPSYYRRQGGFVVAASITKYVYIGMNATFTDDYFLKYSALERTGSLEEIDHPIMRVALTRNRVAPSVEIVSLADIPSGTGLGSSGSFTVGLLRAIHAYKREHVTAEVLAEEACTIEIDDLARSVGKQDQYIAAFGGLTCFEFSTDGRVEVSPLGISAETLHELEDHLLMFFTGFSREADRVLADQKQRTEDADRSMIENLAETKRIGYESRDALQRGDCARFGDLMHEHWELKRQRSVGMSNDRIDAWYALARDHGARGGKLVGAGAGGFLLFYAPEPARLRRGLAGNGLAEVRFAFDHDGSVVLLRG